MTYEIVFAKSARRELERLPNRIAGRIFARIEQLSVDPRPTGTRKLQGSNDLFRVRSGDYRVTYRISSPSGIGGSIPMKPDIPLQRSITGTITEKTRIMGRMFNPPHPGESIREDILPALGITVTEAARQLGVSRVTLTRLVNGQAGISAEMARRMEAWLGGPNRGPTAESWLRMQVDYDLWHAIQQPAPRVVRARALVFGTGLAASKGR